MREMAAGRSSIEAASPMLLSNPLDFLFAEHFRHRELCNLLEELALATRQEALLTREIIAFLDRLGA